MSRIQPILLILDDLHCADAASLDLLMFPTRELGRMRLFIIGTYRDVELDRLHPLAKALSELMRERVFKRHFLRGLSGLHIKKLMGTIPCANLIENESLLELTNGNPLYVHQLTGLLQQSATSRKDNQAWLRLPEGIREVIGGAEGWLGDRCIACVGRGVA